MLGGHHRFRLLVVDDEIAIGRTLAIALADECEVSTATSGREAHRRCWTASRGSTSSCAI